jgi:hypothetical protein
MKLNQSLNDVFNIESRCTEHLPEVIDQNGEVILPETNSAEDKIEYDYDRTRSNLHSLLAQGQDALLHALEVAKQSEHPRAFEVVGNMVKQLADVNNQLLDLSEKRQKLIQKKEDPKPSTVNNNAIFVGSTADLKKMIDNMHKGD